MLTMVGFEGFLAELGEPFMKKDAMPPARTMTSRMPIKRRWRPGLGLSPDMKYEEFSG